jgi:hypothetical protein
LILIFATSFLFGVSFIVLVGTVDSFLFRAVVVATRPTIHVTRKDVMATNMAMMKNAKG